MNRAAGGQLAACLLGMSLLSGVNASAPPETASPVEAPPDAVPWERGSLRLGAFFPTFDSELGFRVGGVGNLTIDGEDTLDLPSTLTVFRGDALYRLGRSRRHQLDLAYSGYRRSAQTTLTEPIDIGDGIVIPATRVDSVLNFDIIRLSYTYAFLQSERVRVGGGLSAYVLPIDYGLDLTLQETRSLLKPRSFVVPVPALALRADFRLWRELYLTTEVNGVYLELLGFRGMLLDGGIAAEYRLWKRLALGVGYNGTLVDVQSTSADPEYPGASSLGEVRVGFHGVSTFVKLNF